MRRIRRMLKIRGRAEGAFGKNLLAELYELDRKFQGAFFELNHSPLALFVWEL